MAPATSKQALARLAPVRRGYALEHAAPFRDDEECVRWLRYRRPPSPRRRIEVFHGACSIADPENVSALVAQQQRTVAATCADLARRGIEPQATRGPRRPPGR